MSEDVPPTPLPINTNGFNNSYFFNKSDYIDYNTADARYIKMGGNGYLNQLVATGSIDASSYSLSGSLLDFSAISGITNGTVSASKAVIVDTNKDISGFRHIGLTGNLSLSSSSPSITLSNPLTINNSVVFTGGTVPSNTNGIGIRFVGISSTGIIHSYNHAMSSMNNLDINDGAIYIKSNSNVGIGNTSPAYKLHVQGTIKAENGSVLVGSSTDSSRMISCLDSGMTIPSTRYITLGKENSARNQAELGFYYTGAGSTDNLLTIGFHTLSLISMKANSSIGIGKSAPVEGGYLDCAWNINTDGAYRMDGTDVITSGRQFVGSGGVNVSGDIATTARLKCTAPLGAQIFNSDYSNAELRLYCMNLGCYVGNNANNYMYLGSNNQIFITMRNNGSKKTTTIGGGDNNNYMLTVDGSDLTRYNSSSFGYHNSSGNAGTASDTGLTANVGMYVNSRILCQGEIDCISDIRRKKDIEVLNDDFCDRFIEQVIPKSFYYKNEPIRSYGYIAQEILKLNFDGLISAHPNQDMEEYIDEDDFISPAGEELSVSTGSIIPILHNKVRRLCDDIEELKRCLFEQAELISELIEKNPHRKSI